jgi:predicted Zn-dependent protease with MMP-like domain
VYSLVERSGASQDPAPDQGRRASRRRRDRRGRGLRGPLAPPQVPLALTRAEQFDELVLDAVERLEKRWPQLSGVEFAVEDVPPSDVADWSSEQVPLGRMLRAGPEASARIVMFRRPLEARAVGRVELGTLVYDVVVEQVADLLGLDPETIDPDQEI